MPRFNELNLKLQLLVKEAEVKILELGVEHEEVKALKRQLKAEDSICGAVRSTDGKVCLRPPVSENGRCGNHGGNSLKGEERTPAQRLNDLKSLRPRSPIHGLYQPNSRFIESLTDSEVEVMLFLDKSIRSKFHVEEGFDEVILEDAILSVIKYFRKVNHSFEKELRGVTDQMLTLIKKLDELGWKRKTEDDTKKERSSALISQLLAQLDDEEEQIIN